MTTEQQPDDNPTAGIDVDFAHFLQQRQTSLARHLVGDVADYSFALDGKLRRQLAAVGPVRSIAQMMVSTRVPLYKQMYNMDGVAVNPRQYPEIYAMGEDCARRLGIGVPQIFIIFSEIPNAFTIATDDVAPLVVLTSALVETLEPAELLFAIGHECGHIHNLHGVYNTAVEMMVNPVAKHLFKQLFSLGVTINTLQLVAAALRGSVQLFMLHWSRCAEITCDRAGLICCGDPQVAQHALIKLVVGGSERLKDVNIPEFLKQMNQMQSSPVRFMEFLRTHPLIPKRIEALNMFSECEVLYSWRPEINFPATKRGKEETDKRCEDIIGIIKGGKKASRS